MVFAPGISYDVSAATPSQNTNTTSMVVTPSLGGNNTIVFGVIDSIGSSNITLYIDGVPFADPHIALQGTLIDDVGGFTALTAGWVHGLDARPHTIRADWSFVNFNAMVAASYRNVKSIAWNPFASGGIDWDLLFYRHLDPTVTTVQSVFNSLIDNSMLVMCARNDIGNFTSGALGTTLRGGASSFMIGDNGPVVGWPQGIGMNWAAAGHFGMFAFRLTAWLPTFDTQQYSQTYPRHNQKIIKGF